MCEDHILNTGGGLVSRLYLEEVWAGALAKEQHFRYSSSVTHSLDITVGGLDYWAIVGRQQVEIFAVLIWIQIMGREIYRNRRKIHLFCYLSSLLLDLLSGSVVDPNQHDADTDPRIRIGNNGSGSSSWGTISASFIWPC